MNSAEKRVEEEFLIVSRNVAESYSLPVSFIKSRLMNVASVSRNVTFSCKRGIPFSN